MKHPHHHSEARVRLWRGAQPDDAFSILLYTTPVQLTDAHTILLYGGSFDPPHLAHTTLPVIAARDISADVIAFIPAGQPPHKRGRVLTDPAHRLAMLRLAVSDIPNAVVLTDEIDRAADGRPSYTVDTLEDLHQRLGSDVTMRLLFGADMLRIFTKWHKPGRIVALAEPLVMVRPPDTRESLLASLPEIDRATWAKRLVDVPSMDISSTTIREKVRRGEPIDDLVSPQVATYIRTQELYTNA